MQNECKLEFNKRASLGWPMKKSHCMAGSFHREYFNDLATTANIENIPEVYMKIYDDSSIRRHSFPTMYRNDVYTIVDDEHFERHTLDWNFIRKKKKKCLRALGARSIFDTYAVLM